MSKIKPYKKGLYMLLADIKAHEANPVSKIEPVAWMRDAPMWLGENRYEPRKVVSIHPVEGAEPLFTEAAMQQAVAEATASAVERVTDLWEQSEGNEPYLIDVCKAIERSSDGKD